MIQRCQAIGFAFLLFAAGFSAGSDHEVAGVETCRLLLIDSEDAEPYTSFRRAFSAELERLRCGADSGPAITRHSIDNQEGLARRLWRTEDTGGYDAVVVQGTIAAAAVRDLVRQGDYSHPVFFANVTDPVELDLIEVFDEPPSGRFTGIAYPVDIGERLRFVRDLFPDVESLGLVHTTMPQSRTYNARLREVLDQPEFQDLRLHAREVPFVSGGQGMTRSISIAREEVSELDSEVDVFLVPNDQMGADERYVRMVSEVASSPLIGVDESNLDGPSGAVAALYPPVDVAAELLADKIVRYLAGEPFQQMFPRQLQGRPAINPDRAEEFGLNER